MTVFDYIQGNTKRFWWMETFPSTKTTLVSRERLKLIILELIYSRIDLSLSRPRWFWWMASNVEGRDPFNQNSNRSDREKRTTSKGGPVFSKLFRLDRTDPLSFGPKFPEILVEWIAPEVSLNTRCTHQPSLRFISLLCRLCFAAFILWI